MVTEMDSSLLPAVIVLAILSVLLLTLLALATYCYFREKKVGKQTNSFDHEQLLTNN